MKNDLKKLEEQQEMQGTDLMSLQDEFNVGIHQKIRKSIYYIIARGIKFGFELDYLTDECQLN